METYSSFPPVFYDYDCENDEKQIIYFPSESFVQQKNYQLHCERNQSVYDSYEEDSWTGDEGDKEGLLEQLISSSCSTTVEHQTSEPQCDILDP